MATAPHASSASASSSSASSSAAPSPQRRDERTPQREGRASHRADVDDVRGALPLVGGRGPREKEDRDARDGDAAAAAAVASSSATSLPPTASATTATAVLMERFLRYEAMVSLQEREDAAAQAHLRPLFERLTEMGRDERGEEEEEEEEEEDGIVPKLTMSGSSDDGGRGGDGTTTRDGGDGGGEDAILTFPSIVAALELIEERPPSSSFSASFSAGDDGDGPIAGDIDSDFSPEGGEHGGSRRRRVEDEVISADRQLVLVLRTLADAYAEDQRREMGGSGGELGGVAEKAGTEGLTFPEFLHCYRAVIAGMQAMQRLPPSSGPSSDGNGNGDGRAAKDDDDMRARTRERTLRAVRMFGPAPEPPAAIGAGGVAISAGEEKKKTHGVRSQTRETEWTTSEGGRNRSKQKAAIVVAATLAAIAIAMAAIAAARAGEAPSGTTGTTMAPPPTVDGGGAPPAGSAASPSVVLGRGGAGPLDAGAAAGWPPSRPTGHRAGGPPPLLLPARSSPPRTEWAAASDLRPSDLSAAAAAAPDGGAEADPGIAPRVQDNDHNDNDQKERDVLSGPRRFVSDLVVRSDPRLLRSSAIVRHRFLGAAVGAALMAAALSWAPAAASFVAIAAAAGLAGLAAATAEWLGRLLARARRAGKRNATRRGTTTVEA